MSTFFDVRIIRNKVNDLLVNVHKLHVIRQHYTRNQNVGVDIYPTFDSAEKAQMYNPMGYVKRVVVSIPGSPICDLGFPLRYVNIPATFSEYDAKNIARASYAYYIYNEYNNELLSLMRIQHMFLTGKYWGSHITAKWIY